MVKKLFLERQMEVRGEIPTTFNYQVFSSGLRNQMEMIWGKDTSIGYGFKTVVENIRMAVGRQYLADASSRDPFGNEEWNYWQELMGFFHATPIVDYALTVVEEIGCLVSSSSLENMNYRMRRDGVGYKHTDETLIRIEDEVFFDSVTMPCLSILSEMGFENAKKHFLEAYEELKQNKFDDALTDCAQAMESVIKTKLVRATVPYSEEFNLARLLPLVKQHAVVPSFMHDYLNNLFSLLQGLGTTRNKEGAHGKTEGVGQNIDDVFVRFVINQTAANILFLAEARFNK